VTLWS